MFFKYLFSQLRLYMSDSQQFADITAKLLNIFSFTEKLWKEYQTKHSELELVITTLRNIVPTVEKASVKQEKKKNCKSEVDAILDAIVRLIRTHESKVDTSKLQPALKKLIEQQKVWQTELKGKPQGQPADATPEVVAPKPLTTMKSPILDSPEFLQKLENKKVESEIPVEGGRYYISTKEALDKIDYNTEIEFEGTRRGTDKKITKKDLEQGLKDSNLELCGEPMGDKTDEYWSKCPRVTRGKLGQSCRVKPTIDVRLPGSLPDDPDVPAKILATDGFCVKTKDTLKDVTPETPAHLIPQVPDPLSPDFNPFELPLEEVDDPFDVSGFPDVPAKATPPTEAPKPVATPPAKASKCAHKCLNRAAFLRGSKNNQGCEAINKLVVPECQEHCKTDKNYLMCKKAENIERVLKSRKVRGGERIKSRRKTNKKHNKIFRRKSKHSKKSRRR